MPLAVRLRETEMFAGRSFQKWLKERKDKNDRLHQAYPAIVELLCTPKFQPIRRPLLRNESATRPGAFIVNFIVMSSHYYHKADYDTT
jgi:hypothetical protein